MGNGPATYLSAYLTEHDVLVREVQRTPQGDYVVRSSRGVVAVAGPAEGAGVVRWARDAADDVAGRLLRPRSWRELERRRLLGLPV